MQLAPASSVATAPIAAAPGYESVPCNLCGSWNYQILHPAQSLIPVDSLDPDRYFSCTSNAFGQCGPIVRCLGCSFVYLNPRPTADTILGAYQRVVDMRYDEERDGRLLTFEESLAHLIRHERSGRLLDVGCLTGVFLQVACEGGFEVMGVEPSEWAARYAMKQGFQVHHGVTSELPDEAGRFDVITCWDVVEHFSDPREELRQMRRLLRPGGLLALSTMDVESLAPRLLGRRWPWYMQMHLCYFSRRTLDQMLREVGFEPVEYARHRRTVRLGYLVSRLEPYTQLGYRAAEAVVSRLGLSDLPVSVDLGDLFVAYARRVD